MRKYILCRETLYEVSDSGFVHILKCLIEKMPFNLTDFGKDVTDLSIFGRITNITYMTPEEASEILLDMFANMGK